MAKSLGKSRIKKTKKQRQGVVLKMKKLLSVLLTAMLLLSISVIVNAVDEITAYVSISNGELFLAYEEIKVSDVDNDGKLTINDALFCAHEAKYIGGATKGYASSLGAYGLKIDKLWGSENGDSFGYYVNDNSAMSLEDEIKRGDHVYAFVYTDLEAWSDTYSFFDKKIVKAENKENVSLSLSAIGFDESWNTVISPVKNATVIINGNKTNINTDENGNAVLNFDAEGKYVITAASDSQTLVPPVCIISVSEMEDTPVNPATPGDTSVAFLVLVSIISFMLLIYFFERNIRYDK